MLRELLGNAGSYVMTVLGLFLSASVRRERFVVVAFSKVVYKFISTSYVLVRGNAIPGFFWAGKFGKYFFG